MPNGFYVLKQKYVHIHVHSTNGGAKIQIYEEPLGVVILITTHTLIEVKKSYTETKRSWLVFNTKLKLERNEKFWCDIVQERVLLYNTGGYLQHYTEHAKSKKKSLQRTFITENDIWVRICEFLI